MVFSAVRLNNKWGIINPSDEFVINPQFEEIGDFNEGVTYFKENGKYGYINENNEIIIPPIYDRASDFSNSFSIIYEKHKRGYIDRKGIKFNFPDRLNNCIVYEFSNGYAWFKNESGWGVINEKFDIIFNSRYKNYYPNSFNTDGFCLISRSFEYHHDDGTSDIVENIGYIDIDGNEYWENSSDPDFYIQKAKQRQDNSPREAIFQYECGYEKDRTRHDILYAIGNLYLKLMEYENAIIAFSNAFELDPVNFEYILLKGNSHLLKGEYQKALQDYEICKRINENDVDLHVNIWHAKFKMEDTSAYYSLLKAKELGYNKADVLIKKYYQ